MPYFLEFSLLFIIALILFSTFYQSRLKKTTHQLELQLVEIKSNLSQILSSANQSTGQTTEKLTKLEQRFSELGDQVKQQLQHHQTHQKTQLELSVQKSSETLADRLRAFEKLISEQLNLNIQQQQSNFNKHQDTANQRHAEHLKTLQETIQQSAKALRQEVTQSLNQQSEALSKQVNKLTEKTEVKLTEISGQVDKRLSDGFEKTTATFTDVIKRLAIIDEAQKKITELSSNVVSLQDILADKRSRGAFGEVQLNHLVKNVLPASHYSFQYTLSNGKRADCMLFLPEPTGQVAIDSKFPLESFHKLISLTPDNPTRKTLEQTFKQDIKKHIDDIASKYIIANETSDGAMMFLPAEAIFAEIHSHYPELVEYAHKSRVWLVSPTTMMAILTTARAVLKDEATRKQVHIIQQHLSALSKDFERFQKRMDNLARHIHQAHTDVEQVHTSAQKISSRFSKIESVELKDESDKESLLDEIAES